MADPAAIHSLAQVATAARHLAHALDGYVRTIKEATERLHEETGPRCGAPAPDGGPVAGQPCTGPANHGGVIHRASIRTAPDKAYTTSWVDQPEETHVVNGVRVNLSPNPIGEDGHPVCICTVDMRCRNCHEETP